MQTSDLNGNNTQSDYANAIFRQFQGAIFSREHTCVKTLTKIFFDLLLPEIDHVPFLVEHAQTFFAGEYAYQPLRDWTVLYDTGSHCVAASSR